MYDRIAPLSLLFALLLGMSLASLPARAADSGDAMGAMSAMEAPQAEPPRVAATGQGLVGALVSQLGVTPQQAAGGAGALLVQAKDSMTEFEWGEVATAFPNVGGLLAAAPAVGSTALGGGIGGMMGQSGASIGSLSGMAALTPAFRSLGLDPTMVNQFVPVILAYTEGQVGHQTMGLLGRAFASFM